MKLTNRNNLPATILNAMERQNALYNKGPAHRSVTQLLLPPRLDALKKKHFRDITEDAADRLWALLGSAVHHILELGSDQDHTTEERLYAEVDGWVISGQLDCQLTYLDNAVQISDYKVTAVYNVLGAPWEQKSDLIGGFTPKDEWVQQMNMQAYLVETNKNVPVHSIEIIAILRDWQRSKAKNDPFYPQVPIVRVPVPLWTHEKQWEFIQERIRLHREAEMAMELDLPLPECTADERWERGTKYAIIKKGGKRATKTFDNQDEAEANLTTMNDEANKKNGEDTYEIQIRQGESVRCSGFCPVSQWCDQYMGRDTG